MEKCNRRYDGQICVAGTQRNDDSDIIPDDHQLGVFAQKGYEAGSHLFSARINLLSGTGTDDARCTKQATSHSIQVDVDHHVIIDLPARLLNHSCCPNLRIGMPPLTIDYRNRDVTFPHLTGTIGSAHVYQFYAIDHIQQGTQLSFDYETTEAHMESPFECSCGSPNCRKHVQGYGPHIRNLYPESWIAPYLLLQQPSTSKP
jgi:hypothetical protein